MKLSCLSFARQADEVEQRWQQAAASLGPAERQVKFLRLLGAKGAATATAIASSSNATQGEEGGGDQGTGEAGPAGAAGGASGARKVSVGKRGYWYSSLDLPRFSLSHLFLFLFFRTYYGGT